MTDVNHKVKILLLAMMLTISFIGLWSNAYGEENKKMKDLQVVRKRLYESFLTRIPTRIPNPSPAEIKGFVASLQPDGSWPDIDYKDRTRSMWKTTFHLQRLQAMVRAYRSRGHVLYKNPNLKRSILSALDFWFRKDFKNSNWWWNEIGVPMALSPTLILMEDNLSKDQRNAGNRLLKRAALGMTGQNLMWVAKITLIRGCLEDKSEIVVEASKRMADEIRITSKEGIQADFSFHQHGPCLYSGGYGLNFSDTARWAYILKGTQFEFPARRIEILSNYILDGQQWMIRGQTFDYGAIGREITRKDIHTKTKSLLDACTYMAKLVTPRQAEFEAFAKCLRDGKQPGATGFHGNRHFWRSDMMTHRRKDYYTSARMFSNRMFNTDMPCNDEGLKSHHIADGTTFILRTGGEYRNIFPVWDWRKIPGTTIEQTGTKYDQKTVRRRGKTSFVGGVSDGTYGMAAFNFTRDGLTARKAWFYFDDEFVCLGAGITCTTDNPVFTSINQCRLKGNVVISDGKKQEKANKGQRKLSNPLWVFHDGVGYVFPDTRKNVVYLRNDVQTGSWWSIAHRYPDKKKISTDVFSLWLDHGKSPSNACYSYIVAPAVGLEKMKAYAKNPPVEVISNTPDLQAVRHKGLKIIQAAFYKAGVLRIKNGLVITVNKPCLLLVHQKKEGLQIAVSNPKNKPLNVEVEVNAKFQGEGCAWLDERGLSRITFKLQDGQFGGKSSVRLLRRADEKVPKTR